MTRNNNITIVFCCSCLFFFKAQNTNLDKGIAVGNILIQGYSALKGNGKTADPNAKTVAGFCFKNKMEEKITVSLTGKTYFFRSKSIPIPYFRFSLMRTGSLPQILVCPRRAFAVAFIESLLFS